MAVVAPTELLRLWATERITAEHAIGQLVQQLVQLQQLLESQRHAVRQLQSELALLRATPAEPQNRAPRTKRQEPRTKNQEPRTAEPRTRDNETTKLTHAH